MANQVSSRRRPHIDADDEFHMADTAELETLADSDTDVLETMSPEAVKQRGPEDPGFDPYNNGKLKQP